MNIIFYMHLSDKPPEDVKEKHCVQGESVCMKKYVKDCSFVPRRDDHIQVCGNRMSIEDVVWLLGDSGDVSVVKIWLQVYYAGYDVMDTKAKLEREGWRRDS